MINRKDFDYKKSCEFAKKAGLNPLQHPDDDILKRMNDCIDRVLPYYYPDDNDCDLDGVFIYWSSDQTGYEKETIGLNIQYRDHHCIIGLSAEILSIDYPEYHDSVLLHELAHLCCADNDPPHDEEFQDRFNYIEWYYYMSKDNRADSKRLRKITKVVRK